MDNKTKKGHQDDAKIDINDPNEVNWILKNYGLTKGNLAVAMHVTKSVSRKIVLKWLAVNWPRIRRA
jgi:hypothetical protein